MVSRTRECVDSFLSLNCPELPSTAWPCRLRHVPGQTVPELTYDDGPFKSGIQALQRAQYGRKLENYQPPSDNPFDSMFGEEIQEPTPEEVQLREIYAAWVDLHVATRRNLQEFEQRGFQLPKMARGHGPVKKLVRLYDGVLLSEKLTTYLARSTERCCSIVRVRIKDFRRHLICVDVIGSS
jgi:hypothetical protein